MSTIENVDRAIDMMGLLNEAKSEYERKAVFKEILKTIRGENKDKPIVEIQESRGF